MLPGEGGVYTGRKIQGCCQGRGEHTLVEKFEDIFGGAGSMYCNFPGKRASVF